jgi:hypothetical protein
MTDYDDDKEYAKLKRRVKKTFGDEMYRMDASTPEAWSEIAKAVNQGIDSHLEAITQSEFDASTGTCVIHPADMPVLIRRLSESNSHAAKILCAGLEAVLVGG